jgi:hypothetical protein
MMAAFVAIPALAPVLASAVLMEPVLVTLGCVLALATTIVVTIPWIGFARHKQRRLTPVLAVVVVSIGAILSVMMLHWPLRLVYLASLPSMERLSADLQAGRPTIRAGRVGLISLQEAVVNRRGIVCLWTRTNPGGNMGFVQRGREHVPFNLFSSVSLDDRWQFIAED